ncbi:MAG: hypothetical protein ACI9CA_002193 [Natronomonas sp.]|jgi:hypothetical protein
MPTIRITDDQHDRIERLRTELSETQTGPYASVNPGDVLAYLLDLADEADDPERRADLDDHTRVTDDGSRPAFPRAQLERQLRARNRKHGDEQATEMDLYTIAAEYDIAGRSNMTKPELVDALLEETERLYADPFHWVDIDFQGADRETEDPAAEDDATAVASDEADTGADRGGGPDEDEQADAGGSDQLTAALNLLETHDDKWRQADGDARYEVELPDGDVQTARTKDDIRAVLFKHY